VWFGTIKAQPKSIWKKASLEAKAYAEETNLNILSNNEAASIFTMLSISAGDVSSLLYSGEHRQCLIGCSSVKSWALAPSSLLELFRKTAVQPEGVGVSEILMESISLDLIILRGTPQQPNLD